MSYKLDAASKDKAVSKWLLARDNAVDRARNMIFIGVHKQIVNRLLEPWMWITVLVSSTEYNNFFNLRCHKDAQPEMAKIAWMMLEEYNNSLPCMMNTGS